MDPLTALGLASNVSQFISFACELFSKTKELHSSASASATGDILTLEVVGKQLEDLGADLDASLENSNYAVVEGVPLEIIKHLNKVKELAKTCKRDCLTLSSLVEKLKVKPGGARVWQSFRAALISIWQKDELAGLEKRLHQVQASITVELCSLANHWHELHQAELDKLRKDIREMNAQQSSKLDYLAGLLKALGDRIETAQRSSKRTLLDIKNGRIADEEGFTRDSEAAEDVSFIEKLFSNLRLSTDQLKKQQSFLKSLSFENRSARHGAIPEAHVRTFRWAFESDPDDPEQNILDWLKRGDKIFWVSGKPGSGKSTFMKFLAGDVQTQSALATWAQPKRAIIASHYFWSSGTTTQKSQQGLLQTLLFDVFRQCPELIATLCNERLAHAVETQTQPWTIPELHTTLQELSKLDNLKVKFCFFIDGLDEYEGDHLEFCAALRSLSQSPHIKLCLASRPWNAFQDAFGRRFPKLYIHDLTRGDIYAYTEDRLETHPRWDDLQAEASDYEWLITQVVERSSGVFLWVFLVTKLLRDGLTEYNSFADLRRRLESFPSDLEDFFQHILETVEPFHHNKMATALSIAVAKGDPMDVLIYHFHDLEYEDKNSSLTMTFAEWNKKRVRLVGEQTGRQLNGRCRGLLEVDASGKVNFLHRTVADFLNLGKMSAFLAQKTPPGFSVNLTILRAYVALVKSKGFPSFYNDVNELSKHKKHECDLKEIFAYARYAAEESSDCKAASFKVLENLEHHTSTTEEEVFTVSKLRDHILRFQLLDYIRFKLNKQRSYLSKCEIPALLTATFPLFPDRALSLKESDSGSDEISKGNGDDQDDVEWPSTTINTLQCLLESGQDANKKYPDPNIMPLTTPWATILGIMIKEDAGPVMSPHFMSGLEKGVFTMFLTHGARRDAKVYRYSPNITALFSPVASVAWVDFLFICFEFPYNMIQESIYLEVLDMFMVGADFAQIGERIGLQYPGNWDFGGDSGRGGVPCKFFTHLQARFEKNSSLINKRLLIEVTDRVLAKMVRVNWPLAFVWRILEQVFADSNIEALRDKYSSACTPMGETAERSLGGKRAAEDVIEEREQKRGR